MARPANIMMLDPTMTGDVYKNYQWSINQPNQMFIEEVPLIRLYEYQATSSPLMEDLKYTFEVVDGAVQTLTGKGDTVDPYINIYRGVSTGNVFQFPFFSTFNHLTNNTWSNAGNDDVWTANIKKGIEKLSGVFQYGNIENRKVWSGSDAASYQFGFTLYNTYNADVNIPKNLHLIRTLINNNLADRTSFATLLPPCYYKLEIPGVRYSPIAALNSITVENIGQVNRKSMPIPDSNGAIKVTDINIPDAWDIIINVNELHNESRAIYNSTWDKDDAKITLIAEKDSDTVNKKQYLTG